MITYQVMSNGLKETRRNNFTKSALFNVSRRNIAMPMLTMKLYVMCKEVLWKKMIFCYWLVKLDEVQSGCVCIHDAISMTFF